MYFWQHLLYNIIFLISLLNAQVPSGYYDDANGLSGTSLQSALHEIINDHTKYPYTSSNTDVWDIVKITDEDPSNSANVILIYTGRSQAKTENSGQSSATGSNRWNREHVWSKSHGFPNESDTAYTDLHHLKPADESVNSSRGNLDFDNGGSAHSEATDCNYDSDSWEPRDAVKGDVARMMFYMEVRYDPGIHSDGSAYDLELVDNTGTSSPEFGKLSTLIAWHSSDPVDNFEKRRNDSIYAYQGNRNPFIDFPEFVNSIWGSLPLSASNLSASYNKENSVTLSWSDNATNETGYKIYQDETLISTLNAGSTSLSIDGLTSNTKYKFWVKSYNSDGESFPAELYVTTKGIYISEVSEGTSYTCEFLELYNNSSSSVNLTGYKVVMVDASDNSSEYVFDIGTDGAGGDISIPALGFWVLSRGANESTFTSGFSSFPSSASFYDGNTSLYFGTSTARKWRLRANDGTANMDDGTLIDETSSSAAGSGKRTIQNPNGTFTTSTSSSGSNSNPGLMDVGQRLRLLEISGNSGFRMLSSPVSGTVYNDLLGELWTQGITGSDAGSSGSANIWTLDVSNQSWSALSNISSNSLSAGQGFLIYVYEDIDNDNNADLPVTLSVTGASNTGDVSIGSIPDGDYYLAGNPYPQTIDWDLISKTNLTASTSVWDDASSSWKSWNGSTGDLTNGLISPYQGFWVQASGGVGSFTIQDADLSSSAANFLGRVVEDDTYTAIFTARFGNFSASTYFSFTSDGSINIDKEDVIKMLPIQADPRVEIMTFCGDQPLKINSLSNVFEIGEIITVPLEIYILGLEGDNFITTDGQIDFSWSIGQPFPLSVTLTDHESGDSYDLTSAGIDGSKTLAIKEKGGFGAIPISLNDSYPSSVNPSYSLAFQYHGLNSDSQNPVPKKFTINKVYPNPFNPSTKIEYFSPSLGLVKISIHNLRGALLDVIFDGEVNAGDHQLEWQPVNFSSGIYIMRFEFNNEIINKKITLIK